MVICPEFSPIDDDAAQCTCRHHWNDHSQVARAAFMHNSEQERIQKTISACIRDNQYPCTRYWPVRNWEGGTPAPPCECGRPRISHPSSDVIAGIKAYRRQHGLPESKKDVCGHFYSSVNTPGNCVVCDHQWIKHKVKNRGLIIEAFSDLHKVGCKCIMMNGDVQCSCMTDTEIQAALDKLSKRVEAKVSCKQFKPQSQGNTNCSTCDEQFYEHSQDARDGHQYFIDWRASHMSNKELLEWFMGLEGKNREQRLSTLKRFITDPNFKHLPEVHMVNPDKLTIMALIDALDRTQQLIKSPTEPLVIDAQVVEVIDDVTKPDLHICYSCGEVKATVRGQMCPTCSEFMAGVETPGPVSRISNDKGGS